MRRSARHRRLAQLRARPRRWSHCGDELDPRLFAFLIEFPRNGFNRQGICITKVLQGLRMSRDTIDAKIGSFAPDFRLHATDGQDIALSDFRGKTNVVLFFIREYN